MKWRALLGLRESHRAIKANLRTEVVQKELLVMDSSKQQCRYHPGWLTLQVDGKSH